ncbi:MAG: heme exporter protein CcmD [Salinarimonas sp.]|nr:heme exporter protein CcmD [Salinarimonas sp.]
MFDQYAPFIIGSYAAFVAIIGGLGLYLLIDQRIQRRQLAEHETRRPQRKQDQ